MLNRIYLSLIVGITTMLSSCASLEMSHYILAYDPATQAANYFKVEIDGNTYFSKSKFSIGEYDRESVNRIFSEADLRIEALSSDISLYNANGERIQDLTDQLTKAKAAVAAAKIPHLIRLNTSIAGEISFYQSILAADSDAPKFLELLLAQASTLQKTGQIALTSAPPDLIEAAASLESAYQRISSARVLLNYGEGVRHFDPDGNEIDVKNMSQLIFVSTDASRFTSAIREISESKEATNAIIQTILGPKIQQQTDVKSQVDSSNIRLKGLYENLNSQLTAMENLGPIIPVNYLNAKANITAMARNASGQLVPLGSAEEIRNHAIEVGGR